MPPFSNPISLILFFINFFDVFFQSHSHGRCSRLGSLNIDFQTGFGHCLCCGWPECGKTCFVLLELRKVLKKRSNARGAEKNDNIVSNIIKITQVAANGFVQDCLGILYIILIKDVRDIFLVYVCAGVKKLFFLVFFNHIDQIAESLLPVKYFAFAVLNVFLEVKCSGLGNTEVLHCIRNGDTHFTAHPEVVVNSISTGHDYRTIIKQIDPLFAKIFCRNPFNMDKLPEVDLYGILFRKIKIRRFVSLRFRLCDKNAFYFQWVPCYLNCKFIWIEVRS